MGNIETVSIAAVFFAAFVVAGTIRLSTHLVATLFWR